MPEQRESVPVFAQFSAHHLIIGCGVAIFHVASARVVVCHHTRDGYWFLPKGRRDAGEMSERAAEREGFEEVQYYSSPTITIETDKIVVRIPQPASSPSRQAPSTPSSRIQRI